MKPNDSLTNFIPISRKLFDNQLWKQKRVFSWAEAWLDLIQMARYEETEGKVITGDGKVIKYYRTEIVASNRYLAKRWIWGNSKLSKFLLFLKDERMIETRLSQGITIVQILNYDLYNKRGQERGTKRGSSNPILQSISEDGQGSDELKNGAKSGQSRGESNIVNNVNNKEREDKPSPTQSLDLYSQEDRAVFEKLQNWISINTPFVAKMKCQITIDEFIRLRKKSWYTNENLMSILGKMDNYKGVNKNIYVYRTVLNWAEREYSK